MLWPCAVPSAMRVQGVRYMMLLYVFAAVTAVLTAMRVQGLTTEANSIYIRIADNCPCVQYDSTTGAETGVNSPCCGNVNHFDLSYFAFEKVAHPVSPASSLYV